MAKLVWAAAGARSYEMGVDRGVLYPQASGAYPSGVAWDGLINVTESPSGAEVSDLWSDNRKYASLRAIEQYGATIEAYKSPEEFDECDGTKEIAVGVTAGQQARVPFGFCFRTKIGNDLSEDAGYKLHLIYGATANPSERNYATVNESPEPITLSWELATIPVDVPDAKPTACLTIDSTRVPTAKMTAIEDILYGGASEPARLPLPAEVITVIGNN